LVLSAYFSPQLEAFAFIGIQRISQNKKLK
jgi:hypothetical protein